LSPNDGRLREGRLIVVTLSVICAAAPGPNPGMHTVDLAMQGIRRRLQTAAKVRFLVLYEPGGHSEPVSNLEQHMGLGVNYEPMLGKLDELHRSDAILYWGDFLHACRYRRTVMDILRARGLARGHQEAAQLVGQYLFLTDADPRVLARTLIFGQTLIFNRQADYLEDATYNRQIERLIGGVRRVWMREVYSAQKAARIRCDVQRSNLGVDCALLLCDQDVGQLPTTAWLANRQSSAAEVGVFFGRSSGKVKLLGRFAAELCARLDAKAEWLPWGHKGTFDDLGRSIRRGFRRMQWFDDPQPPTLGDLLARLRQYTLVITDTYHLCLNAWRLGVPAVCIMPAVNQDAWSVSSGKAFAWRDKRQVFYAMYDAMDYCVYAEEIMDRRWRHRRTYQLATLLRSPQVAAAVAQQIRKHSEAVADDLVSELHHVLELDRPLLKTALAKK
jgi:hypothetical protein